MIAILPASIEQYLKDAKFSMTEILVIRKLLEEDALTLRELATKTGKSTGVLDQALKKLLGKGIANKQAINGGFKYTMGSLKPILDWMEKDMQQKYEMLERRHQNFEAFIESLSVDKARPEMQYFDGEEGIKRAYIKLLDSRAELLCYWPHEHNWEEHPMRDFYVQYFRERHRRNIFSRVISHDTVFGRRFQTRDPFEYRKTVLVPEEAFPIPFEKVISGDVVACFDHKKQQACFIKYPEFTHAERMLFENHWKEAQRKQEMPSTLDLEEAAELAQTEKKLVHSPEIELRTRVLSQLRDFFLSKSSIVSFGVFLMIAGAITFGLYKQNEYLNLQRMREKVESIAATAASQFDAKDLNALQVESDWKKPQWSKVVHELEAVRTSNKDLMYAYIIRPSKLNQADVEFVSDSHSLNPYANVDDDPSNDVDVDPGDLFDLNNGVTATGANYLQWPGQHYPSPPEEALRAVKSDSPLSSEYFYSDQWGTMITGYAPIKDAQGNIAGVLAVDMNVLKLQELQAASFSIVYCLAVFFILFAVIRFTLLNKQLCYQIWQLFGVRKFCFSVFGCLITALLMTFVAYRYSLGIVQKNLSDKLMSIAQISASDFSTSDLDQLRFARDLKTDAYQRVFLSLNKIREKNQEIVYVYIMRKTAKEMAEFVADADSNYTLPFSSDLNSDGLVEEAEEQVAPGVQYSIESDTFFQGFERPSFDTQFIDDQWGALLSGYAPIPNGAGKYLGSR